MILELHRRFVGTTTLEEKKLYLAQYRFNKQMNILYMWVEQQSINRDEFKTLVQAAVRRYND